MKKDITVTLTFEIDEEEIQKPAHIWLYQLINRLNYETPVKGIEFHGKRRVFNSREDIKNIGLREKEDL